MLKGISPLLSPDLLYVIACMGHGDELVIGDRNYPAVSTCDNYVRADGIPATDLLDAILELFPLDKGSNIYSVELMAPAKTDAMKDEPPIWKDFKEIISKHDEKASITSLERFDFYEKAKKAFACVSTGESKAYGCLIIRKGVVSN